MNEINELMELTGKTYLKKFIIALALMFLYTFVISYGWANNMFIFTENSIYVEISFWFTILFIIILLWMHHRRFKSVLSEGSFHRIRLLPIPKMSIVYSELLYVGAIYTMMVFLIGIGWLTGVSLALHPNLNEIYYLIISNPFMASFMPMTLLAFLRLLLVIVMLSYVSVTLLLSKANDDVKITARIVYIIFLIVTLIFNYLMKSSYGQNAFSYSQTMIVYIVEMLVIIAYSHYCLYKCFGRKEKTS